MTSLQYYCIPGLPEIKTYAQKMQDAKVTKSLTVSISIFYTKLWVFSQIKDRKHIEQNFHSVARIKPQEWDLGVLGGGGLKTLAWGFAMEPYQLHVLVLIAYGKFKNFVRVLFFEELGICKVSQK